MFDRRSRRSRIVSGVTYVQLQEAVAFRNPTEVLHVLWVAVEALNVMVHCLDRLGTQGGYRSSDHGATPKLKTWQTVLGGRHDCRSYKIYTKEESFVRKSAGTIAPSRAYQTLGANSYMRKTFQLKHIKSSDPKTP